MIQRPNLFEPSRGRFARRISILSKNQAWVSAATSCMSDLRGSVNAYGHVAKPQVGRQGLALAPGASVLHPCNLSGLTCEDAFRSFLSHGPSQGRPVPSTSRSRLYGVLRVSFFRDLRGGVPQYRCCLHLQKCGQGEGSGKHDRPIHAAHEYSWIRPPRRSLRRALLTEPERSGVVAARGH